MDIALKWLTLLHNPEDIVEIRSIDLKPVISGYFKADSAAIAKEIARFPNRTFYQTLQMVQPACYARGQHEHLMERPIHRDHRAGHGKSCRSDSLAKAENSVDIGHFLFLKTF